MSIRLIVLLVAALGAAGTTAMLAQNWLAQERAQIMSSVPKLTMAPENKVEILVAKDDLVPGSFVLKEKLAWQEWPEDALNELMLKKGDVDKEHFAGSVVRSRVPAGQPLLPSAVVKAGERGFLAAVLAPGMRAVTVPISAASGVGGFVFPGDKVDLLVSINLEPIGEDKENKPDIDFTQTLLTDVRVLGKDQMAEQVEGEAKVAKTVTLEVTPKQAEMIALSNRIGKMSLALRSLAEEEEFFADARPHVPEYGQAALKHPVDFAENAPVPEGTDLSGYPQGYAAPLQSEGELSLTTDYEVNYFFQKLNQYGYGGSSKKGNGGGSSVEVLRGSNKQTREF